MMTMNTRRMTMTRAVKITLLIMTFLTISMLVLSGLMLQDSLQKNQAELAQIYSRKEDLQSQQQKLQVMIAELNATLDAEISRNQDLKATLEEVTQEQIAIQEAAAAAAKPPPQKTVVVRQPVTTTRAS